MMLNVWDSFSRWSYAGTGSRFFSRTLASCSQADEGMALQLCTGS